MSVRSRQVTAAAGAGIVAVALLPAVSAGAATPTYRHSEGCGPRGRTSTRRTRS